MRKFPRGVRSPLFFGFLTLNNSKINPTPVSLLLRLRQIQDKCAWDRFVDLYTPLLFSWARGLDPATMEAADLVQEVFFILVQKLPEFRYIEGKSFRGWLWTLLLNKWREARRRRQPVMLPPEHEEAAEDNVCAMAEEEYRVYLVNRAMALMREHFQASTWQACWEHVAEGRPAAEVAKELAISENAVYLASSRVLHRLRQELQGLLE